MTNGQAEAYYYLDDQARKVFYSKEEISGADNLEFLGKTNNPNPRMAAAVFLEKRGITGGYSIRPWQS